MDPQRLISLGFIALAAGALVALSFGPGFRIGRLLARTPDVPLAAAIEAARAGRAGYVRLAGRIDRDADGEVPERPEPVLRRTRFQVHRPWGWRTVETTTEAVPFLLSSGPASVGIDAGSIGPGLVVAPRASAVDPADIPERIRTATTRSARIRAVVEQVSVVDRASALGVPVRGIDGTTRLAAGMGRPLILTTLEPDEAVRLLGGDRPRTLVAAALLALGVAMVVGGLALAALGVVR